MGCWAPATGSLLSIFFPQEGGPGAGRLLLYSEEEINCSPALKWTQVLRPAAAPRNFKMKRWLPLPKPSQEPAERCTRDRPRGQWAIECVDALSFLEPETEGLELLPSLPESSHMTLGTSILASANSFYGQQNRAEAPRALCVHEARHPWTPAWVVTGPLTAPSALTRGPRCLQAPPLSTVTQGFRVAAEESGPHRQQRASTSCKTQA